MPLAPFLPIADIGATLAARNARAGIPLDNPPDARLRQAISPLPSLKEIFTRKPDRMEIHNLVSGDFIEAQFNPTELDENIKPNWNRQNIPGMSHPNLQYSNNNPYQFSFALFFDSLELLQGPTVVRGTGPGDIKPSPADMGGTPLSARNFLQSLCYPRGDADDVTSSAPPRCLFFWPNFVSLTCVVDEMSFRHTKFLPTGHPAQFTADITLIEIRDVRLTSQEVREVGTLRSPTPLDRSISEGSFAGIIT